jgi:hypothetical protein
MEEAMERTKHTEHQHPTDGGAALSGLSASAGGYTLDVSTKTLASDGGRLNFVVRGPDGGAVRKFRVTHERELHLILVSRDLLDYAHLHPTRDAEGNWSVSLPHLEPGTYRLYTDFEVAGGPALTLREEATAPGERPLRPMPPASPAVHVDGFGVALAGALLSGSTRLLMRVEHGGAPAELEPYLGANAHLVAIRAEDGAFLHVHPLHDDRPRHEVAFNVHFPSGGRYRLFLDFQVHGVVRTAAFTVEVTHHPERESERHQ